MTMGMHVVIARAGEADQDVIGPFTTEEEADAWVAARPEKEDDIDYWVVPLAAPDAWSP